MQNIFKHSGRAELSAALRDAAVEVREKAAIGAVGIAVMAAGVGTGVAVGSTAHDANATIPKSKPCETTVLTKSGGTSANRETVCVSVAPEVLSEAVYPGNKVKFSVKVYGGSGKYSYDWKLNKYSVDNKKNYTLTANNNTENTITGKVQVVVHDKRTQVTLDPYVIISVSPKQTQSVTVNSSTTTNNTTTNNNSQTTTTTTTTPVILGPPPPSIPSVELDEAPAVANQGNIVVFSATILNPGKAPDSYNWTLPAGLTSSNQDCVSSTPTCTITAPTVSNQTVFKVGVSITDSNSIMSNFAVASVTVNPPVIVPPPGVG